MAEQIGFSVMPISAFSPSCVKLKRQPCIILKTFFFFVCVRGSCTAVLCFDWSLFSHAIAGEQKKKVRRDEESPGVLVSVPKLDSYWG